MTKIKHFPVHIRTKIPQCWPLKQAWRAVCVCILCSLSIWTQRLCISLFVFQHPGFPAAKFPILLRRGYGAWILIRPWWRRSPTFQERPVLWLINIHEPGLLSWLNQWGSAAGRASRCVVNIHEPSLRLSRTGKLVSLLAVFRSPKPFWTQFSSVHVRIGPCPAILTLNRRSFTHGLAFGWKSLTVSCWKAFLLE